MSSKSLAAVVRRVLLREASSDGSLMSVTRVDSAEPMSVGMGQEITVRGSGFTKGAAVTLTSPSGKQISAQEVKVANPGTITAYIPGLREMGDYKVTVASNRMSASLTKGVSVGMQRSGGPT